MKHKRIISLSLMFALSAGLFMGMTSAYKNNALEAEAASWTAYTHYDGATYYNGISDSLTGDSLTSALRTLNNTKKKKNGGYNPLLKGDFWARYTDFDEKTAVHDNTHNLPYSNTIVSFYSGNTAYNGNGMNREHVWPNSKGGNLVEDDSHMARPTLTSENSARGNSFYVEGMRSTSLGWDPAAETWGDETYRGDSARIIFYCAMANGSLSLVDKDTDSNSNNTMGRLTHLLKWNLKYPVKQREMNRNEAVEAIQGNRNPFIDHPEYVCKIWGNVNAQTKAICGGQKVTVSQTSITTTVGKTIGIYATTSDANEITWTSSDESVVTLNKTKTAPSESISLTTVGNGTSTITAKIIVDAQEYTAECKVTVKEDSLSSITLSGSYPTEFNVGDTFSYDGLVVTANYSVSGAKVVTGYSVSTPDMSSVGSKTVTVSYTDNGVTKTATYTISVSTPVKHVTSISLDKTEITLKVGETYQLVATINPADADNKEVTWSPLSHDIAKVSTTGKVTAKAIGTVTVTATTVDGGLTASCVVKVVSGGTSSGCGGNIVTTSIVLSTLSALGIGLLLIKRKFTK